MRISQMMIFNSYTQDVQKRQRDVFELHNQLTSGKKVNKLSDDPVKAVSILSSRDMISSIDQYMRNINSANSYLTVTETALDSVKGAIGRIQELSVTMASATANPDSRRQTGIEVSALLETMKGFANTTFENRYVFSGFKSDTATIDGAGVYQGDGNKQTIITAEGVSMEIGMNGGEIFSGVGGGVDIFQITSDLVTALNGDDTQGIHDAIGELDTAFSQISDAIADIGGKGSRLRSTERNLHNVKIDLEQTISGMEDADITEVISELSLGQVALEAALQSAGRIFSTNIFNYI